MCKHVAAVLYGVGNRLDCDPGLLFELRGVDAQELIAQDMSLLDESQAGQADTLADQDLGDLFGIEMDSDVLQEPAITKPLQSSEKQTRKVSGTQKSRAASKTGTKKGPKTAKAKAGSSAGTTKPASRTGKPKTTPQPASASTSTSGTTKATTKSGTTKAPAKPKRFSPTGPKIRKLRLAQGLSFQEFADKVGACEGSVRRWESKRGKNNLRFDFLQAMQEMFEKMQ
jgi:DNA-binding transcriptional regulator YiaG